MNTLSALCLSLLLAIAPTASARPTNPPVVDAAQAIADVRSLTTPEMAGRATGSPGGKLARAHVAKRFGEIGLSPIGKDFSHPFGFTLKNGKRYDDAANVIGALKGALESDRWLVISAHYDHLGEVEGKVYPGADDNASGVAALLAIAAHFKANPPKHSVLFVSFDAEEIALRGAREFVEKPPVPLEKIAAILNLDMVSANIRNEVYMAGTYHRPWLKPYIDEAAERAQVKVLYGFDQPPSLTNRKQDWTVASDHGPFHLKGIPFVYFGVEDHPNYHQPTDTFANFNREFFVRAVPLFVDVATVLDRELAEIAKKGGR
ncbi:MAG: M20/M25/M40 family metallo-hydrolase [Betaproteobacteria bacterium]|nr:M20/M25/M40 family metallo-hydrolase [Betaproteobacteria bacterium]